MPSVVDDERPVRLLDALRALDIASRTPAKQRSVRISSVVDVICQHAYESGLDGESLRAVVQIASTKTELDQASVTALLKNLYPAQRVPADLIATVVGALGQGKGKPSPGTQNALVRWLIAVHDIIDEPNVLSCLYGVLFGMLDSIRIRTCLCHLLSLITRRKHVKPFRIQQLLELARGLGNEPALQGLLRIYKDYYPDIILGSTSVTRRSFPPQLDEEWRSRVLAIHAKSIAESESGLDQRSGFQVVRKGPRRSKTSAIPDVHTYHANEASVTLEGVDSAEDFVEKLEKIEPPGQLISFLTDPLLQKYVELRQSPIVKRRIELWLSACLEEQYNAMKEGSMDSQYHREILEGLLSHAQYTKSLSPIVQSFLKGYLLIWDGMQNVDVVLGLLSYIPIQPFTEAHTTYLQPAERTLSTQGVEACETLIGFYTSLLRQWINNCSPLPTDPDFVLSHPDQRAVYDLAIHVSTLCTSLILSLSSDSPFLTRLSSATLSFYDLLSASPKHIPIIPPPLSLIHLLFLTPSLCALSRITAILANYKRAMDAQPSPLPSAATTLSALTHNPPSLPFPLQIMFPAIAENEYASLHVSLDAYLASLDPSYNVLSTLSLSAHPALASLSRAAWIQLEDREMERQGLDGRRAARLEGPVGKERLEELGARGGVRVEWGAWERELVGFLEERGVEGLGRLREVMEGGE